MKPSPFPRRLALVFAMLACAGVAACGPSAPSKAAPSPEASAEGSAEAEPPPTDPIVEPHIVSAPTVTWPKDVTEHKVRGNIVVKCTITREGNPQKCRVTRRFKGGEELEKIALEMLKAAHFEPARRNGKAVEVDLPTAFVFK